MILLEITMIPMRHVILQFLHFWNHHLLDMCFAPTIQTPSGHYTTATSITPGCPCVQFEVCGVAGFLTQQRLPDRWKWHTTPGKSIFLYNQGMVHDVFTGSRSGPPERPPEPEQTGG